VSSPARRVPGSAVRRLSLYLRALERLEAEGVPTVSSLELASRAGATGPQVRKDLSHFGSFGTRGRGYGVPELRAQLWEILGLTHRWRVALIGAGRVGAALFAYPDFRRRGFEIVAIYDNDPAKVGRRWGGIRIRAVDRLPRTLPRSRIEMAILAVPAPAAQDMADAAVAAGVRGILNFAPVQIRVPAGVSVNHVNMAVELESLSFALHTTREGGETS